MTIDQHPGPQLRTRSGRPLPQGSGMGGGIVAGAFAQASAMRPTLYGERWAVVAGHPLVTEVGATVLAGGGNAIDAGVAAGFASNVVQVDMCNLGGIAPILVRAAGSAQVHSIAGVGVWGEAADLARIRDRYDGRLPLGGVPCIVPGAVSGWLTALRDFGTMGLPEILTAAIEYAERGFLLDPATASHFETMSDSLRRWESSAQVYLHRGRAPRPGQRLRQPALARTLRRLAEA
ncbi:MAG: gamma-glutamyltransferase, partial [Nocardioides sp.]|uniref:gamma-glutamyltransferase n=1 Tax=Nocardioides sp. TaxID=35761 RepID=UPI0039E6D36A